MDAPEVTGIPEIAVVTPTWNRHNLLLNRCIPSVQAQTYPVVRHIIVSDGPDPDLREKLRDSLSWPIPASYHEMPEHDMEEHWGHAARANAVQIVSSGLITYCDDDDALRPAHCSLHVKALTDNPEAGFSVSRMLAHGGPHSTVIGWGPLAAGNVGSPMIAHRREILKIASWSEASWLEDWLLVSQWLDAGVRYVNVNAETSDIWPSRYRAKAKQQ
jgi:glycosyltransferase involved in cell wall biosynthesis